MILVNFVLLLAFSKPDVGPENAKSKTKFTKIMKMIGIDHFQVPRAFQADNNQGNGRQSCYPPARKNIPTRHGTIPMRINTHDPIPGSHRGTYRKDDQKNGR